MSKKKKGSLTAKCPYCKEKYFKKEDACLHRAFKEIRELKTENARLIKEWAFVEETLGRAISKLCAAIDFGREAEALISEAHTVCFSYEESKGDREG